MQNESEHLYWNNYWMEFNQDPKSKKQYRGFWNKDRTNWQGLGEIKFSDGSCYQGQTQNKLFNGKGRMNHSNGDIYQGEWKNGKADGFGIFVDTEGSMYEGEWINDLQNGHGVESWNNGKMKYSGDFVEGKKTGKGKFEFEGSTYEGDFVDG